jgi:hemolysin activation/secretion protein
MCAKHVIVAASLSVAVAPTAWAQRAPDAGSILRDFGGSGPQQAPPVLPAPDAAPAPPVPEAGGGRVQVNDFRIRATQFPETTLRELLRDYIDRELSLSDLREAAFRISEYYRQHDLLGRAVIPRQTIRDGVVEIVVLEGRLGNVAVDPSSKSRLDPEIATGIVANRAPPGQILHPSQLQEGVAILNEIPGVAATATMRPGTEEGETIADLKLRDTPLVTGVVQADNYSPYYIGSRRAVGNLAFNNPFGRGEQISVLALKSTGSVYGRAAAQMPVGTSGLTLGVNQSYLSFDLEGPFKALKQGGYAYSTGVTATYPFERRPDYALSGFLGVDHKRIVDKALGADIDYRRIDVGNLGLTATSYDTWLGSGINEYGARLTIGNLDRGGNGTDLTNDALTARSNGYFAKLNVNAARVQGVVENTDVYLAANGQVASRNLDSSEKLSLGGPYGVRAYPVNEGNGDDGFLATAELRYRLPYGLMLFGLYDIGGIRINQDPWLGWERVEGQPNQYVLQGAGFGMSWTPVPAVNIKATYAHTIGPNPGKDASGNNADGQQTHRQFWVMGRLIF